MKIKHAEMLGRWRAKRSKIKACVSRVRSSWSKPAKVAVSWNFCKPDHPDGLPAAHLRTDVKLYCMS